MALRINTALLLLATGPPAMAEVEQVIVTGSHLPIAIDNISAHVSVIDQSEIEQRNNTSAVDLLRQVPGLHISQQGSRGGISVLYLRGAEPNFSSVLIDGIQLNDPTNTRGGSFDFATLDVDAIERVEIVRGPQSALYGSDSLSGVINIITKGGGEDAGQMLRAELGGDGYRNASYQLLGEHNRLGYALTLGTTDAGEWVKGSRYRNNRINSKTRWDNGQTRVEWTLRYVDADRASFPEDSGGPRLAVLRDTDIESIEDTSSGLTLAHRFFESWQSQLSASWYQHRAEGLSPGVAPGDEIPPFGTDTQFTRSQFNWNNMLLIAPTLHLGLGADAKLERGSDAGFVDFGVVLPNDFKLRRSIYGAYVETIYTPVDAISLLASLRHDKPESAGDETTAKAGLIWRLPTATTFSANWGEGFKLPSFFALGSPLLGNPDLLPERSVSYDIGVSQEFMNNRSTLTLRYFNNTFEDLIDFDDQLFTNVNRSEVTTAGGELSLRLEPTASTSLQAHATYLETDVVDSDTELRGRPRWEAGWIFNWQLNRAFNFNLEHLWRDTTLEAAIPTRSAENPSGRVALDSYHRVDVNLTWQYSQQFELTLAIDNVLDEDYEEAVGFPAPGLEGRVGVRVNF